MDERAKQLIGIVTPQAKPKSRMDGLIEKAWDSTPAYKGAIPITPATTAELVLGSCIAVCETDPVRYTDTQKLRELVARIDAADDDGAVSSDLKNQREWLLPLLVVVFSEMTRILTLFTSSEQKELLAELKHALKFQTDLILLADFIQKL